MRELLLWHVYLFGYLYRVDFIREMSTEPSRFLKILEFKSFFSGISIEEEYENTYAYVFSHAKLNRPIFLAYSLVKQDIKLNNGKYSFNLTSNNFTQEAVNTLCHELSHFVDLGGLDDVYTIINGKQYGPYGDKSCLDLALYHPSASLLNSDNLSFFVQGNNFKNEIDLI